MKAVVQRVISSQVDVDGKTIGKTDKGLLVLLGVSEDDTEFDAEILAKNIANLSIFCDENDKMNLSVLDINGGILAISNFTLCADTRKGNRPSFSSAKAPNEANELYELFVSKLKAEGVKSVNIGQFGADMKIPSLLDGPVTIIMDSCIWRK